jgi:peptidoglycan/LPS O-acetylase OafA/YrhL
LAENERRFQFRLLDLVVLVAAAAVGLAGAAGINNNRYDLRYRVEAAFWLVLAGYVLLAYLVVPFARTRETRLIVLGVGLVFAAAADALYLGVDANLGWMIVAPTLGMSAVALALVIGGIVHGLRARRDEADQESR